MAINLDAIRKKVAQLSGQRGNSNIQLWKPDLGEYKVRLLPSKYCDDNSPILERYFYYWARPSILAPYQFGKADPVNDLIRKIYNDPNGERAIAKQLRAKMRAYAPLIVRGQEDKGVQVWSFGKMVYQRLLSFFIDEDFGNILDPQEGFDLKVVISKAPGKDFNDIVVDCKGRPTPLSANAEQAQKWIDSVPNVDQMWTQSTTEEVERALTAFLAGTPATPDVNSGETSRGKANDELDELVSDVKKEKKNAAPKKEVAKKEAETVKKNSLDEAFDDLMDPEENGDDE